MEFEFATAQRIVFGSGSVARLGALAGELGHRVLLVRSATERASRSAAPISAQLAAAGLEVTTLTVTGEPTVAWARVAAQTARAADCDLVVGLGGGSVLDGGKAVAALVVNSGDPLDYLEVIGAGRPLVAPSLPYLALPTTAGTGSEVTRNAVLACEDHGVKVSLRSAYMLPTVALVDPELTWGLPADVTASTGLDALTQLIEPLVSRRAQPLTDAICRDGIPRAARHLRAACTDDPVAREQMALASLLGGLALANAGLGAVHGLAAPLGGRFGAPHGAVCATLLPHVMAANLRLADEQTRTRYDEVARLLTGSPSATAAEGVACVAALVADLAVPRLSTWGIGADDLPAMAEAGLAASSMKANPVSLDAAALVEVMARA